MMNLSLLIRELMKQYIWKTFKSLLLRL